MSSPGLGIVAARGQTDTMTSAVRPVAAAWTPAATLDQRLAAGRAMRRGTPRRQLSHLTTSDRDPLGIIAAQNATRVQELVPLRTERMSQSAFTFYRGTAGVMAADLARDPHSGILVASCGDAHVSNFGFFASRQRTLLFDLNDFDEAAWAPWEWDVKRLVASVVVGGQATHRDEAVIRTAVLTSVRLYARSMAAAGRRSPLDRYYEHFDADASLASMEKQSRKALTSAIRDARKRTGERATRRLTVVDARGRRTFTENPPTLTHVDAELETRVQDFVQEYLVSAREDIGVLLAQYSVADLARRVVGVGSVGTRCYLIVFQDGEDNTILLQTKEALPSVLSTYGGIPQPASLTSLIADDGEGARVVALQRILQAMSDPFLGHLRGPNGDFYARQFHDMKGGIDVETLEDDAFVTYAQACAATLARAHGQSGTAPQVAGYIGKGDVVGEALLEWAFAYAELASQDYAAFLAAS
jgi:uncharacterized protein (DUF2252 family)